jgi:hypothetical protein
MPSLGLYGFALASVVLPEHIYKFVSKRSTARRRTGRSGMNLETTIISKRLLSSGVQVDSRRVIRRAWIET